MILIFDQNIKAQTFCTSHGGNLLLVINSVINLYQSLIQLVMNHHTKLKV